MSDHPLGILQALNEVHRAIGPIFKTEVDAGAGGRYKAFRVDDIYDALRPLFAANGIVVIPKAPDVEFVTGETRSGATTYEARLLCRWELVSVKDGSRELVEFRAASRDTGDKHMIQAAQLAWKYALVQMFFLAAGDPHEQPPQDHVTVREPTLLDKVRDGILGIAGDRYTTAELQALWPGFLQSAGVERIVNVEDAVKVIEAARDLLGPVDPSGSGQRSVCEFPDCETEAALGDTLCLAHAEHATIPLGATE